jgi:sulfoxide reductase heme-binding subunit YedZ
MEEKKTLAWFREQVLRCGFFGHDWLADQLSRHTSLLKRVLLLGAWLVLLVLFLPLRPLLEGDFGEIAGNLLIVILFVSPLSRVLGMRLLLLLMGFRRELGILMGCLALVHGMGHFISGGFFAGRGWLSFDAALLSGERGLMAGFIGLLLILPLLLTSNTLSLRWLGGKAWKRLHRLAYPAFFFIVLHRFFMEASSTSILPLVEVVVLLGTYSFLQWLAFRPQAFPSLREQVSRVGARYRQYQETRA